MSEITERLKTAIADRYTAELVPGELFSIQSTIVEQVASALGGPLGAHDAPGSSLRPDRTAGGRAARGWIAGSDR